MYCALALSNWSSDSRVNTSENIKLNWIIIVVVVVVLRTMVFLVCSYVWQERATIIFGVTRCKNPEAMTTENLSLSKAVTINVLTVTDAARQVKETSLHISDSPLGNVQSDCPVLRRTQRTFMYFSNWQHEIVQHFHYVMQNVWQRTPFLIFVAYIGIIFAFSYTVSLQLLVLLSSNSINWIIALFSCDIQFCVALCYMYAFHCLSENIINEAKNSRQNTNKRENVYFAAFCSVVICNCHSSHRQGL